MWSGIAELFQSTLGKVNWHLKENQGGFLRCQTPLQNQVSSVLPCPTSPLCAAPRSRGAPSRLQGRAGVLSTALCSCPCNPEQALPSDKCKVLTNQKGYKQFCVIVDVLKRCKISDTIRFILRSIKSYQWKSKQDYWRKKWKKPFKQIS